jgi:hypothetical protein
LTHSNPIRSNSKLAKSQNWPYHVIRLEIDYFLLFASSFLLLAN